MVQPDVFVVCDGAKLEKDKVNGAPDLIFEILSPGTQRKDRWVKKKLYEQHGVREYILVDTHDRFVEQYILQPDGKHDTGKALRKEETLILSSLDHFPVPLIEIFSFERKE